MELPANHGPRRRERRNSKPRDDPGSLPLEAALRNCRRILTGTLGDGPAGRGRRARHCSPGTTSSGGDEQMFGTK